MIAELTPWYRQFWPWFLIALPACAVIASVATLVVAIRSPVALVVSDYNRIEEITAQTEALDARASALGLSARVDLQGERNTVTVLLAARVEPASTWRHERLRLTIGHPTRPSGDQVVWLTRLDGHRYQGDLARVPSERRYLDLRPDPESALAAPMWRLAGDWRPGRTGGNTLSAAPPR